MVYSKTWKTEFSVDHELEKPEGAIPQEFEGLILIAQETLEDGSVLAHYGTPIQAMHYYGYYGFSTKVLYKAK